MPEYLEKIRQVADMFGRGLLLQMAPRMVSSLVIDLFDDLKLDKAQIQHDVTDNRSLWDALPPDQQRQLRTAAQKLGDLDFLTADFVIQSIKKEPRHAQVASLLLNWPEANEWLARQLDELKTQAYAPTAG